MNVRVKLFAVAKQRVGHGSIEVKLPPAATVRQLRGVLVEQFPSLADVIPHVRFAVNSDYAADATAIPTDAEVAMIPPVSGG